jgi:hypothetical protein
VSTFEWIEQSDLAILVAESLWGYPIMICLHAIGLAVVVGTLVMVNLRIFGLFKGIPFSVLRSLMRLAWAGFVINLLSGSALFSAQATVFIENVPFLIKLPSIFLALIVAGIMQNQLQKNAAAWDSETPVNMTTKALAACSIMLWLTAIVAGRLTAYL